MGDDRDALVVTARLDVAVRAPDGRTASVRLTDRDGTLVLDMGPLPVLLAALPGAQVVPGGPGLGGLRRARGLLAGSGVAGAVWVQPVDVVVDGHLLLRRRGGRWRATPRLLVPATAALTAALLVVAVAVATVAARLRRLLRGY